MNKKKIFILFLTAISCVSTIYSREQRAKWLLADIWRLPRGSKVMASEGTICTRLEKINGRLEEGMLDIPEDFQRQMLLYIWITEAVNQYAAEKGIEEFFYCDLKKDILYGSREFTKTDFATTEWGKEKIYEYSLQNRNEVKFEQDSYKLKLEGTEHVLYVDVNIQEGIVYLYPAESGIVITDFESGNPAVYERIEHDINNQIKYYPDDYVESEWDDMKCMDGHFAEVSLDELDKLDYLRIPDDIELSESVYLNVASVLKRYIEENEIEDIFYFNAEEDIISSVTNMIYTCRLRGQEQTLYMDIDAFNLKCHVYQLEE